MRRLVAWSVQAPAPSVLNLPLGQAVHIVAPAAVLPTPPVYSSPAEQEVAVVAVQSAPSALNSKAGQMVQQATLSLSRVRSHARPAHFAAPAVPSTSQPAPQSAAATAAVREPAPSLSPQVANAKVAVQPVRFAALSLSIAPAVPFMSHVTCGVPA